MKPKIRAVLAALRRAERQAPRQTQRLALGLVVALASGLWGLASPSAAAEPFPERPVKIVQGFAPGGNADTIARVVGTEMARTLGQSVIVEAQTGAGGNIAAAAVARARPDGYTLLLATGGHAVAGAISKELKYRTVDDFEMVSMITSFPFLWVVRADSPYTTLAQVLADARAGKAHVSFGTAGNGTTHHLAGELLRSLSGADLLHVPYRGDAASITALLSDEVTMVVAPPTAVVAHLRAGKLRALAVTGPTRWAPLPDVPTVAEQGVTGYDVRSWAGLMAPAGTPRAVIDRLNAAVVAALRQKSVNDLLVEMGGEVAPSTPEDMKALVSADLQRWIRLVNDNHIARQ